MCHLGLIMEITMTKFLITAYFLRLTLDVLTFKKVYRNVKTARSDRASVSIIAEVQIMQDLQHFARASDYFLGKTTDEISDVVLHVFEAHLRDICEQLILKRIEEGMGSF